MLVPRMALIISFLNSMNGTFLDGKKIGKDCKAALTHGARISFLRSHTADEPDGGMSYLFQDLASKQQVDEHVRPPRAPRPVLEALIPPSG
jgi:hypothetical protein